MGKRYDPDWGWKIKIFSPVDNTFKSEMYAIPPYDGSGEAIAVVFELAKK